MSDDLDFDMEVVEEDKLDELGADGASDSERRSRTENDKAGDDAVGSNDIEVETGNSGKPNPSALDSGGKDLDHRETNPSIKDIDVEGWKAVRADDLMYITRGASPRPKGDPELFGGDIPWVKISDVDVKSARYATETSDTVTEKGAQKSKYIPEDTLIVSNSGTCGYPVFLGMDACVHDGWLILKEYEEELNADYLYEYITWKQNYLKSLAPGSTQINLNTSRFGSLDIQVPPLPEQRKIASVLYAVDQAIQKTEEIIEQARRVRRGSMQDLFQVGLDEEGKLRLPEEKPSRFRETQYGLIPESWKIKPLDALVAEDAPITYGIVKPGDHHPDGVPVVKVKDIIEGQINEAELLHTDPEIHRKYDRAELKEGDLLFSIRGTVGRMAFVPPQLEGGNITQDTARIRPEKIDATYLRYYLETDIARTYFKRHKIGQAVQGVNLEALREAPVLVPSREEQEKIVSVVKTYSDLIQKELGSLGGLRRLKKGLMQDLLTGEVRTADKAIDVLDEVVEHG
jgi:type I restriction enzyme S subunit